MACGLWYFDVYCVNLLDDPKKACCKWVSRFCCPYIPHTYIHTNAYIYIYIYILLWICMNAYTYLTRLTLHNPFVHHKLLLSLCHTRIMFVFAMMMMFLHIRSCIYVKHIVISPPIYRNCWYTYTADIWNADIICFICVIQFC